jgi:hypothetical protein
MCSFLNTLLFPLDCFVLINRNWSASSLIILIAEEFRENGSEFLG